ncbi:acyl dehydratase [Desulfosalsimonas propionicica]|uniref:Acyl dehydratase n=1 Tax=Desulfosalsimonas propionicica TaxID=332175 RepID=A0A7W0CC49_9BACT|nr:MaoC/PaaZ C-terminal domain-containing protein [Desulfosalsimonas propionicica]MBA2882983.1 acyl dehydratase [Desulfosalsimonas propionicica]
MNANAQRYFEDVKDSETLPSFEIIISRTHIIKYVGAGGDFQPIHHDEEFAKSIGLPSIFANGLMHGGMLTRVITDWAGDGVIKRYKLRFTGIVWPKDTLTFLGNVRKKYQENGENLVDCTLMVKNQKGENTIEGEATVSLPTKQKAQQVKEI